MKQNSVSETGKTPNDRKATEAGDDSPISFSALLKHGVIFIGDRPYGRVDDVIVKPRQNEYAGVTGLVVQLGKRTILVPAVSIIDIRPDAVELRDDTWDLRPFTLRDGDISLKSDILCQRVIDVPRSVLVKVYDVRLARQGGGWAATAVDVHRSGWFALGSHTTHAARDWRSFLSIPRDTKLPTVRSSPNWIGRLKPAQIADLIEAATGDEQDRLLAQVHTDPELEADVFEELDQNSQAQLFKSLDDAEVGEVLSRMRADDVADAIMELAQERRQTILDLLPDGQRTKVLNLLGYNKATAGGLMGTEFLALPQNTTVGLAIDGVRDAKTHQPEALTTIYSLAPDGRLAGTLGLVQALQSDPSVTLQNAADANVIAALPEDDIIAVVTRMADFNLLSLPVLDENGFLLGVVTVDDALEAAIPKNWSRR